MTKMSVKDLDLFLLHLADGLRQVVDPADVYYLEAQGEDTRVRLRSARPLVDRRPLRDLIPMFEPYGFLQIHREHAVNLRRIRQIRRRPQGRDWEVKLEPPVNRVLPVGRSALPKLWRAFESAE
jgi:DNA-binding LytR/AlgR family response regulator